MNLPVPFKQEVKKPEPTWSHIAGIHVEEDGSGAVVWLGQDKDGKKATGRITLYDSWVFEPGTHFALIADAIKARGDGRVSIAWEVSDEFFVKALRDRGCKFLAEGYTETPDICATDVREIGEKLSSGLFFVLNTNTVWFAEYEGFVPKDGVIPQSGFPLMSATRHALHFLRRAKPLERAKRKTLALNYWGGSVA